MLDNSGEKKMQHKKELQSIMQAGYHFRAPVRLSRAGR